MQIILLSHFYQKNVRHINEYLWSIISLSVIFHTKKTFLYEEKENTKKKIVKKTFTNFFSETTENIINIKLADVSSFNCQEGTPKFPKFLYWTVSELYQSYVY